MSLSINQLLQAMMQQKGSDLHLAANSIPMIRVRGEMVKVQIPPLNNQQIEALLAQFTSEQQRADFRMAKTLDLAHKAPGIGIFRVNVFLQRFGVSMVFRALSEHPPNIDDLNLPPICKAACSYSNGLVLVTGPTGSGKSTTLAAMLNHINQSKRGHILTLEDPIEFQHASKQCMVNQRALNDHFTDFSSALRSALREDPDVILVGELRDTETIELAIKAAETGHLVFATLHTGSAPKSVDRMINVFPGDVQPQIRTVLSETLKVVISQKLVPTRDKKSRLCIQDIMVVNPAISNLIRDQKLFQIPSAMQTGRSEGMQVFDMVLMDKVNKNEVDGRTAWEFANEKKLFSRFAPRADDQQPMAQPAPPPITGKKVA